MTGLEIKTLFEELIDDDELSDTTTYILMTNAEEIIEEMRDWMILRTKNVTEIHGPADTYETEHTLPTNFKKPRKVGLKDTAGNVTWLDPVKMEDLDSVGDINGFYSINYADKKLHITGNWVDNYTVIIHYKKTIGSVSSATTLPWEGKQGSAIAYQMAQFYENGIDGDSVNFQMSAGQIKQFESLKRAMVQWDTSLQMAEMNNQSLTR